MDVLTALSPVWRQLVWSMRSVSQVVRFVCACLAFCVSATGLAETLEGKVIGVTDGDTLTVLEVQPGIYSGWIVRLTGIDAPEKRQPFGNVARQRLADLVFQRKVTVEWRKRDRYGRTLGKVLLDGVDVNLEMVRTGHAWVFTRYLSELAPTDQESYLAAELEARAERRGLWLDATPIPPWDWRKAK